MAEEVELVDNAADRFYELKVDGTFAGMLIYELSGSRRVFTHTFVEAAFRGRGLSNELVRLALDEVRANHETITNYCGIVDGFIARNPEYEVVIDPAHPGSWARYPHPSQ